MEWDKMYRLLVALQTDRMSEADVRKYLRHYEARFNELIVRNYLRHYEELPEDQIERLAVLLTSLLRYERPGEALPQPPTRGYDASAGRSAAARARGRFREEDNIASDDTDSSDSGGEEEWDAIYRIVDQRVNKFGTKFFLVEDKDGSRWVEEEEVRMTADAIKQIEMLGSKSKRTSISKTPTLLPEEPVHEEDEPLQVPRRKRSSRVVLDEDDEDDEDDVNPELSSQETAALDIQRYARGRLARAWRTEKHTVKLAAALAMQAAARRRIASKHVRELRDMARAKKDPPLLKDLPLSTSLLSNVSAEELTSKNVRKLVEKAAESLDVDAPAAQDEVRFELFDLEVLLVEIVEADLLSESGIPPAKAGYIGAYMRLSGLQIKAARRGMSLHSLCAETPRPRAGSDVISDWSDSLPAVSEPGACGLLSCGPQPTVHPSDSISYVGRRSEVTIDLKRLKRAVSLAEKENENTVTLPPDWFSSD